MPKPPLDYSPIGWARTGKVRLRSSLFGFVKAEELWQHENGHAEWRPLTVPLTITKGFTDD